MTVVGGTERVGGAGPVARWSVGGVFLEGLAARDYGRLTSSLSDDVRLRALLPPGPAEWQGAEAVADAFRSWFGEADELELLEGTVAEVGGRLHLAWRLRVRPAPFGIGEGWHVIEQQAFADADRTLRSLDLLCSGFNPERPPAADGPRLPSAPQSESTTVFRTVHSSIE